MKVEINNLGGFGSFITMIIREFNSKETFKTHIMVEIHFYWLTTWVCVSHNFFILLKFITLIV